MENNQTLYCSDYSPKIFKMLCYSLGLIAVTSYSNNIDRNNDEVISIADAIDILGLILTN